MKQIEAEDLKEQLWQAENDFRRERVESPNWLILNNHTFSLLKNHFSNYWVIHQQSGRIKAYRGYKIAITETENPEEIYYKFAL